MAITYFCFGEARAKDPVKFLIIFSDDSYKDDICIIGLLGLIINKLGLQHYIGVIYFVRDPNGILTQVFIPALPEGLRLLEECCESHQGHFEQMQKFQILKGVILILQKRR